MAFDENRFGLWGGISILFGCHSIPWMVTFLIFAFTNRDSVDHCYATTNEWWHSSEPTGAEHEFDAVPGVKALFAKIFLVYLALTILPLLGSVCFYKGEDHRFWNYLGYTSIFLTLFTMVWKIIYWWQALDMMNHRGYEACLGSIESGA